jgi:signal recognition particle GTPase
MRLSLFKRKDDTNGQQTSDTQTSATTSLLANLKKGLEKTRSLLTLRIDDLVLGKKEIDNALMEQLEEILITADLGVKTSHKLIEQVQALKIPQLSSSTSRKRSVVYWSKLKNRFLFLPQHHSSSWLPALMARAKQQLLPKWHTIMARWANRFFW